MLGEPSGKPLASSLGSDQAGLAREVRILFETLQSGEVDRLTDAAARTEKDAYGVDDASFRAALMALAFLLSLCSTSDAFIAATLDKFTVAARLAFLVFGPMMDIKLVFLYQTVLRKRFIFYLAIGLFLGIGLLSLLAEAVYFPSP